MKNKLAIGAVVGAVAGMIAGVLTAPKSGKETRADIKTKAEELKDKTSKTAEDTKTAAEDIRDKTVEAIQEAVDNVKKKL